MEPVVSLEGITVRLRTRLGTFDAVADLDLAVRSREVLALVGESGSGKSMTALALMRLLPEPPAEIAAGAIRFGGLDLAQASEQVLTRLRGNRIGMIFQEPMTSLNPAMRAGLQVAEALRLHKKMNGAEAREAVEALFALVRIPDPHRRFDDYPHQMSGGMRQRVVVALALSCGPDLLIADEPTTALDVTTQAQILDTFRDLQERLGTATILITHDLAVVAETADRVAVMYAGRIVEEAPVETLFEQPLHPYTRGLLNSIPRVIEGTAERGQLTEIPGMVPPLWALPEGCAFAPRCPLATSICREQRPPLVAAVAGHKVACWHAEPQKVYA
jgi:oligopeptide/dipeptide ABC transporter ATP-binding protein